MKLGYQCIQNSAFNRKKQETVRLNFARGGGGGAGPRGGANGLREPLTPTVHTTPQEFLRIAKRF
jgi:hypothetical protein